MRFPVSVHIFHKNAVECERRCWLYIRIHMCIYSFINGVKYIARTIGSWSCPKSWLRSHVSDGDDRMRQKWWRYQIETFSASLALCVGNSPVTSVYPPHKGRWRGALVFSLICAWINGWVNDGEAGYLRRHRAHYDVTVMEMGQLPNTRISPTHAFKPR